MVAALLGLWGAAPCAGAQALAPGTEVFAVDPGRVIEVTYRSPGLMLIAHRWQAQGRFTLICLEKPRQPVTGPAGPEFDVVLTQLTSLKLRRALNAQEIKELLRKNPLKSWAAVEVRDNSALEPFQVLLLPVPGVPNAAFVHFNGVTYVVAFADRVFKLLASGCKSLTATAPALK